MKTFKLLSQILITILITIQYQFLLCNGAITVHRKSSREIVLTVLHEFFPFSDNYIVTATKAYLVVSEPLNACNSIKGPPNNGQNLYSIHGEVIETNWVLLVEDSECNVHIKIVQAQLQGYSGVIIYSNISKDSTTSYSSLEPHLTSLYKVNVSFVSYEDGQKLLKYSYPKPYSLRIEEDWSFKRTIYWVYAVAGDKFNAVKLYFTKLNRSSIISLTDAANFLLRLIISLMPLWFLILLCWNSRQNQQRRYYWNSDEDFSRGQNHGNDNYWERENTSRDSTLDKYRKLLEIPPDATKSQIESAFRQKSLLYHPDKSRDLPQATVDLNTALFRRMKKAKEELLKVF